MKSVDTFLKNISSWEDLWSFSKSLTNQEKGYLFERLTELILQTKPEYVCLIKMVYRQGKGLPAELRDHLRLPTTDEGIDLIAETHRGEFWAIQCKFKRDNSAPTYKEISTFGNLANNYCRNISRSFLFHTGEKGVLKKKLLGESFSQVGLEFWLSLQAEDWERIRYKVSGKAIRPQKRQPRPHQLKAIQAAKEHFIKNGASRGKLIMPCGTGKSLTAFWIAESLKAKTIVVAVPSLSLIKQTLEDWTRELLATSNRIRPEWLCICSDDSTGKLEKDEFVSDVYSLGIPTTTDTEIIKSFLAQSTKGQKIIFTTYQSSERLAKASKYLDFEFDLAILDEAHKTVGEKTKTFATLLLDKNIKVKQRIFMTATERVIRGTNDEVLSMDDKSIYGDRFYLLTFKDAIHSDPPIISDYKILTVMVTNDEIKELITENKLITDKSRGYEEKESQSLAAAVALRMCYDKYGIRHAVSFHSSIARAKDFAQLNESMTKYGKFKRLNSYHISSKKSAGERASLIKEFASQKPSLITNARCLTEGVDVPSIDCVLFADPRQSTVDIVQAVGRALRTSPDKKYGYILLPIIVPDGIDIEEFANSTPYRQIVRIITALSTQDERIAEEFRLTESGKSLLKNRIINIVGVIPNGHNLSLADLIDKIETQIWERVGKANWLPYDDAKSIVASYKLSVRKEWEELIKSKTIPFNIPKRPNRVYSGSGWLNWGDWLGTGRRIYLSFMDAKTFVRKLKLKSASEWREYCTSGKKPSNIPWNPEKTYAKSGWSGMSDWLGAEIIATKDKKFKSYEEAKKLVSTLGLKSFKDWIAYASSDKKPKDIPSNPNLIYRNKGWKNFGDFLGTGSIATQKIKFRNFIEARRFARKLGLKNHLEWVEYCSSGHKPKDIPSSPTNAYRNKGWKSWNDWLGKD